MTTFTTKMLAAVAMMALALGTATAGDKKGGGKPSKPSGPSKPVHVDKSNFKKFDNHKFHNHNFKFHFDKHHYWKHDKHHFHFKWYPSYCPTFCGFPMPCYPWWPNSGPVYPYGTKPIDPGIGNGYPIVKSYK